MTKGKRMHRLDNFLELADQARRREVDVLYSDDPTPETFRWRSAAGRLLALRDIEDLHLLEIERYWRGYGEFPFNPSSVPYERWARVHYIVCDEIERRGLSPHKLPHPAAPGPIDTQELSGPLDASSLLARAKELDAETYGS